MDSESIFASPSGGATSTLILETALNGGENSPPSSPSANDPGLDNQTVPGQTGGGTRMKKHHWLMIAIVVLLILFGFWYFGGSTAAA